MSYWLAIGPPNSWPFCFKNGNLWGFSSRYQKAWDTLAEGDIVVCYATKPVKGIIGYCAVRSKQKQDRIFFPQETTQKQVLWPLRVTLTPTKMIAEGGWVSRRVLLEWRGIAPQRALQKLGEDHAKGIIRELDKVKV